MKLLNESIGLIGGGQMAEALVRGMLIAGIVDAEKVFVIDPDPAKLAHLQSEYQIGITESPVELCEKSTTLILAVKPQVYADVLASYKTFLTDSHLLISIMAGVLLADIEERTSEKARLIRVMPNTPALVLEGASAFSLNHNAVDRDREVCRSIFSAVGTCVEVQESLLDAVTGLSGSGPGYVFTIIDALIDGGVHAGLPRPVASQLAIQTLYGSAKLAMQSDANPSALKAQVTSPGGTTIHGIHVLEEKGIRAALMGAVQAAADRSKELGS